MKINKQASLQIGTVIATLIQTLSSICLLDIARNMIDSHQIEPYLLLFFLMFLIFLVGSFSSQYCFQLLPVKGRLDRSKAWIEHLFHLPISFFKKPNSTHLVAIFQNELQTLGQNQYIVIVVVVTQLLIGGIELGLLLSYYWPLGVILLVLIGSCFLLTEKLAKYIATINRQIYEQRSSLASDLLERIQNARVWIQLREQDRVVKDLNHRLEERVYQKDKHQARLQTFYMTIYIALSQGLPLLCLGIGFYAISHHQLTLGRLFAMYTLTSLLQEPIQQLASMKSVNISMKKLASRVRLPEREARQRALKDFQEIRLKTNGFGFDQPLYDKMDLTLPLSLIIQYGSKEPQEVGNPLYLNS